MDTDDHSVNSPGSTCNHVSTCNPCFCRDQEKLISKVVLEMGNVKYALLIFLKKCFLLNFLFNSSPLPYIVDRQGDGASAAAAAGSHVTFCLLFVFGFFGGFFAPHICLWQMIKIIKNIFSGLFQEIDADIGLLPERRTVSAQDPSRDRGGKSK